MDQDDKVSAAAFSLSSTSGSVRISRALGADDGRDGAFREVEVVAGGSATESEAPSGGPGTQGSEASELSEDAPAASQPAEPDDSKTPKKASNNVRRIRIERMMSKAELARRANLSVLTIDRWRGATGAAWIPSGRSSKPWV